METRIQPKLSWNPWPVAIIGFFAVAVSGFIGFIGFCSLHPSELVAPDYYEQEIRYQGRMDSTQRAQQLVQKPSVTYDAKAQLISVTIPWQESKPVGTVQLYRPSAAGMDRKLPLTLDRQSRQQIGAADLETGLWKVRVSWRTGDQDYFMDEPVVIDKERVGGSKS